MSASTSGALHPFESRIHSGVRGVSSVHAIVKKELTWIERGALLLGIAEIPLQIDKYIGYREADAALGAVAGLNVSSTTLALVILYGIWLLDFGTHRPRLSMRPLFGIPMLVYLASVLLSSLSAPVKFLTLCDCFLLMQAYLLFFYLANRLQTRADIIFLVLVLGATILIQSGLIFTAALLRLDDTEVVIGPLNLAVHEGRRHCGTMHSPVLAGSTLALIWLPVVATSLFVRNRWVWFYVMLATGCGLLAILLTQTRGAILTSAVGVGIIGLGLLSRGALPKWVLPMVGILGVLSLYPLYIVYEKRIQDGDGDSAIARKHLSLIALEMIQKKPLLGYGAGNCHLAGDKFANQSNYRAEWYFTIHSKYLLVWIETGLIGLLSFFAILLNGVKQGLLSWRWRKPDLSTLGLACVAAIAGHSLHMAVDIFNSRTQVQMLWCMLGLTAAIYKLSRVESIEGQAHGT
ncbi:MAG: O-antigen ligase family protein [Pirellula sp.]|jgi:O-antigen ligase|nr:O-antigen ligase family protein [Pirellula sp.]